MNMNKREIYNETKWRNKRVLLKCELIGIKCFFKLKGFFDKKKKKKKKTERNKRTIKL